MKHFSISYFLSEKDYDIFYKMVNKSLFLQRVKLTTVVLAVVFIFTIMNLFSLGVTAGFLLLIMFFLADVINRTYIIKKHHKSKIATRKTVVDFYSDHIELFYLPDENFKGVSEKHYPLSSVSLVMENGDHIYLKFKNSEKIIIPKNRIEPENYIKIKNMINNLYPDKFLEE